MSYQGEEGPLIPAELFLKEVTLPLRYTKLVVVYDS
jgi:hypothetical protein